MKNINAKDIENKWQLVDAKNKFLGRIATEIATVLMGKNKSLYTPYLDTGDHVVVINAAKVLLSGKKELQKKYWRHSGYPGGLRHKTASQMRAETPEELIRHAVSGMLPKNKLGRAMARKLHVFPSTEHIFANKFNT